MSFGSFLFSTKAQREAQNGGKPRSISDLDAPRRSATTSATADTGGDQKDIPVDPREVNDFLFEVFLVGGQKLSYAELTRKHEIGTLKVLLASPEVKMEVHACDSADKDGGRVPTALEAAFAEFMCTQRTKLAQKNGGYAIPRVAIAPRDDNDTAANTMSIEQMVAALREQGYHIAPPTTDPQQPQPGGNASATPPPPPPAQPAPASSGPNPALSAGATP